MCIGVHYSWEISPTAVNAYYDPLFNAFGKHSCLLSLNYIVIFIVYSISGGNLAATIL